MARVLIVIPAHNEERFLPYSVVSVVLQETHHRMEVVIVDDNSSDNTYAVAERLARRYGNVHALRLRRRSDLAPSIAADLAIWYGVLYASDTLGYNWDYITYLDADTILSRRYVERVTGVLEKHREYGVAGGVIANERQAPLHIPGTGMTARREVWEAVGGFTGAPASDTIFQLRAIRAGWKLAVVRSARLYLLRRTGVREAKRRCRESGLVDGYACASPLYSLLRGLRLSAGFASPRCLRDYVVGYLKGRASTGEEMCPVRRVIELHRLRERVLRLLGSVRA